MTWDGTAYDSSELRRQHEEETSRILSENMKNGILASWIPIGGHEEIDRRHNVFDVLSGSPSSTERSEHNTWKPDVAGYLLQVLGESSKDVVNFANQYLAHRIHFTPERKPEFAVSLTQIENSVSSLWNCFNVLSSIYRGGYSTPDIVHQFNIFENLNLPLVEADLEQKFDEEIETVKIRMENKTKTHMKTWEQDLLCRRRALAGR